ncbi:hypothetical protein OEZ85_004912 [Tetradesmus obliquus]|uniref:Molybdenum cofactor sulfurase middle domain-containing protein n=1 Tax=Tetradesmus obliquus TaxID=3088 RepID=A0ABY8UGB4_TETOB|nr:hypothetical protein OEZ85_004912 [Tetradesmus obliquus]
MLALSFYKIFGHPTGLGALLVRRSLLPLLLQHKAYFGGGTVEVAVAEQLHVVRRSAAAAAAAAAAPDAAVLAQFMRLQGPVVSFNLLRPDGSWVGHSEVAKLALIHGICLRTGCFCNPGACAHYLSLSPDEVLAHHAAGHVCWDEHDVIDGKPTGAVRASFGYMSSFDDAALLLLFIRKFFLDGEASSAAAAAAVAAAAAAAGDHKPSPAAAVSVELLVNSTVTSGSGSSTSTHGHKVGPCAAAAAAAAAAAVGRLSAIYLYPIKSCAPQAVTSWPLGPNGLLYDREWALVTPDGSVITQKQLPRLTQLLPEVSWDFYNASKHGIAALEEQAAQLRVTPYLSSFKMAGKVQCSIQTLQKLQLLPVNPGWSWQKWAAFLQDPLQFKVAELKGAAKQLGMPGNRSKPELVVKLLQAFGLQQPSSVAPQLLRAVLLERCWPDPWAGCEGLCRAWSALQALGRFEIDRLYPGLGGKLQLGTAAERRRALRKYAGVGSKQQLQQLATVVQRRRQHIHELDEEARRESEYERVQEMRGMMYHRVGV